MDLCAQSLEGNQTILATGWLLSPDWSPDGSTLAYTRASGVDLEIPELQILTPGQQPFDLGRGGQPDWSPDGTQLVFTDGAADFANVTGDVYVVDADGRHRRRLTHDGTANAARWSPDAT